MSLHHLTNVELLKDLGLRNDLTAIEHELVDRLTRSQNEMVDLDRKYDRLLHEHEIATSKFFPNEREVSPP